MHALFPSGKKRTLVYSISYNIYHFAMSDMIKYSDFA